MTRQIVAWPILCLGFLALLLAYSCRGLGALSAGLGPLALKASAAGLLLLVFGFLLLPAQKRRRRLILGSLLSLLLAWVALNVLLYVYEDRLLFRPRTLGEDRLARVAAEFSTAQELYLPGSNGTTLHGWLVPGVLRQAPLIIAFPGQGGEASRYLKLSRQIPEFSWAFFNYRGYGLSSGTPSEQGLFKDAAALYDGLLAMGYGKPGAVFALGGSLGCGVATYLAAQRPLRGVVLFSPYDKIGGGVAQDLLPLAATGPILRNKFDVLEFAGQATMPALALVGTEDRVILPGRSEQLLAHWGGAASIHRLRGDHYSIYELDESWQAIRSFLFGLLQAEEIIAD